MLILDDTPVRQAQLEEAIDLLEQIPDHIPNSNSRTCPENLRFLLNRVINEVDTFPVDKAGRWVGFVHGVLALSGFMDVDEKRNSSRGRYHKAYEATGQAIPDTMTLETKVVGHIPPRYPGDPKSHREIHELVDPLPLRDFRKDKLNIS